MVTGHRDVLLDVSHIDGEVKPAPAPVGTAQTFFLVFGGFVSGSNRRRRIKFGFIK